eukprot:TRINITY_DN51117_c0_g1_i1.p1 TRINITY_DN51117_c0_g1~~TRINITY_DN51117_c0_g1_i1.p1  ORF type:complete len:134 (+),score=41.45 TRINITY_DN51117_c0_g1_i1:264-665(+)
MVRYLLLIHCFLGELFWPGQAEEDAVRDLFEAADANKDGKVSLDELVSFMQQRGFGEELVHEMASEQNLGFEDQAKARSEMTGLGKLVTEKIRKLFPFADEDKDGFLNVNELGAMATAFEEASEEEDEHVGDL